MPPSFFFGPLSLLSPQALGVTSDSPSPLWGQDLSVVIDIRPICFSLSRALENKGFEIVRRGEIEVKGKGKMTTYFLIQNLNATEDEIMGRPSAPADGKGKKICLWSVLDASH